jgi:NAD(P)-dependent dehydrogenase (short-subunit alcohol dehydrogenase family)
MPENLFDLTGKVALVTGASRGIGKAIALGLAAQGADVVLASRKADALEAVKAEIEALGKKALVVPTQMGNVDEAKRLAEAAIGWQGRVDVLINNAGTNPVFGPSMFVDESAWDKIMGVNLKGPFFLSHAIATKMRETGGGKIVFIASTGGIRNAPGLGVYNMSKAAMIMMTKVLSFELGGDGIFVNCIAPGLIKTKFSQALWSTEEIVGEVLKLRPIKRMGLPEDLVGAALFLSTKASDFVTGETLVVDGGQLI